MRLYSYGGSGCSAVCRASSVYRRFRFAPRNLQGSPDVNFLERNVLQCKDIADNHAKQSYAGGRGKFPNTPCTTNCSRETAQYASIPLSGNSNSGNCLLPYLGIFSASFPLSGPLTIPNNDISNHHNNNYTFPVRRLGVVATTFVNSFCHDIPAQYSRSCSGKSPDDTQDLSHLQEKEHCLYLGDFIHVMLSNPFPPSDVHSQQASQL
jgi:hypothetical protein